jgi:hypothetical protein
MVAGLHWRFIQEQVAALRYIFWFHLHDIDLHGGWRAADVFHNRLGYVFRHATLLLYCPAFDDFNGYQRHNDLPEIVLRKSVML